MDEINLWERARANVLEARRNEHSARERLAPSHMSASDPWHVAYNDRIGNLTKARCRTVCDALYKQFWKLSEDMYEYYWNNLQTPEEYEAKEKLRAMILNVLQRPVSDAIPGWASAILTISGSTVTGLASKNSDVDLCLWIKSAHCFFTDDREAALALVRIMKMRLEGDRFFSRHIIKVEELLTAQIPILKMTCRIDDFVIEVDLSGSCNRDGYVSGVHNSFLLRHFVRFDWRVGPLIFFIKKWAANFHVRGPQNGRFNSYCLTLLVVHYLQCGISPPVLPNLVALMPGFFASDEQTFPPCLDFDSALPDEPEARQQSPLTIAELFYGFIEYYCAFDFKQYAINMKIGYVADRNRDVDKTPRERNFTVRMIDPIDTHNPSRTVQPGGLEDITNVFTSFRDVFHLAAETGELPTLSDLIGDDDDTKPKAG